MPASGGKTYSRETEQTPDRELDPIDLTECQMESAWSDYRINAAAMWERIFARFGLTLEIGDTDAAIPF
jgi:hypothetical protein